MRKTRLGIVVVLLGFPMCLHALNTEVKSSTGTLETITKPTKDSPDNQGPTSPNRVLPGERPQRKNYLIPALEIPAFLLILNQYDRYIAYPGTVYNSGYQSSKNFFLHGPWEFDQDPFAISQLGHPYQGSMMYGFARSSGLNFWEGLLYSNVGSYMWMIAGETDNPRINGQITTGNAGSLLGEELYRMACVVLEDGGDDIPLWRKIGASVISPSFGFNRLAFGNKYAPTLERRDPAIFTRLRLGASQTSDVTDNQGASGNVQRNEATVDFSMAYGLPGKPGYRYLRPLDYFNFQITGTANHTNSFENIMTRGLLIGMPYEKGDTYRGVWGLYGSYDYMSPQIFRVSSTAASLGTTAQWWLSKRIALQGTGLGGLGFGAAGTTAGLGERDYHYGSIPQGLLALRLIFGDRVMLDTTAREYYVSKVFATEDATENISRVDASCTVRIYGPHSIGIQYVYSRREADYSGQPTRHQSVGTVSLAYNYLFSADFGAVEWGRKNNDDAR
jgi:hypothetical protein